MTHPLVTIGILSYNRCDDLRNTLNHILDDEYPNVEILLIDNASTDQTRLMLQEEFPSKTYPQLRTIFNESNVGIAARNVLFEEAKGKYFFSFDDDSYPSTPKVITQAVSVMESDPTIAALCCTCLHPLTGFNETIGIECFASAGNMHDGYDLLNIAAGGSIFRMDDVRMTNGYDPDFFHGREENDLAFQLVHLHKRIVFYPDLIVHHLMSVQNRMEDMRQILFVRNTLWLLWKYFPLIISIPMIFLFTMRRLLPSIIKTERFIPVCKGFIKGIDGFSMMRKRSQLFSVRQSFQLWRSLYKMLYE